MFNKYFYKILKILNFLCLIYFESKILNSGQVHIRVTKNRKWFYIRALILASLILLNFILYLLKTNYQRPTTMCLHCVHTFSLLYLLITAYKRSNKFLEILKEINAIHDDMIKIYKHTSIKNLNKYIKIQFLMLIIVLIHHNVSIDNSIHFKKIFGFFAVPNKSIHIISFQIAQYLIIDLLFIIHELLRNINLVLNSKFFLIQLNRVQIIVKMFCLTCDICNSFIKLFSVPLIGLLLFNFYGLLNNIFIIYKDSELWRLFIEGIWIFNCIFIMISLFVTCYKIQYQVSKFNSSL